MAIRSSAPVAHGERGATVVEFALVAPFLLAILFAIIEFAWVFGQHLDVRHGAREASRLTAVNYRPNPDESGSAQADAIIAAACERMGLAGGQTITLETVSKTDLGAKRGAFARVSVSAPANQITGLYSPVLDGISLRSSVETRLEQNATWASSSNGYTHTGTCS